MALRLAEALNWRGIPSCGFCGKQENHLFVRQKENSRGKRHLNATGAVGKEVKASNMSILVCRPVCHVPVLSPSHQLLQQRVSSSSFLCRVQTLFLIAFATRAHESRALFLKERIHPSITTTPCRRPPVGLTFFCVWVLLGRTLTWIFQAYFLSSLLLFTRSDWWVTEPTFECRNQKKNKDPLGNNCKEITEALCKAESAL